MPFAVRDVNAAPFLRIIIGGRLLSPDEMMWVKSIKIVHNRKKADTLELTFYNPTLLYADQKIFDYGSRVVILGGWNDEVTTKGPFRIEDIKYVFPADGDPNFTLVCKDPSATIMEAQVKSRKFVKYLLEVIREIALEYNLVPEMQISPEENVLIETVQRGESDAMLLQRLAIEHGYIWHIRGNTLYFVRPENGANSTYTLNYRTGDFSLKEFSPELKAKKPGGMKKVKPDTKIAMCMDPLSHKIREVRKLDKSKTLDGESANPYADERNRLEGADEANWGETAVDAVDDLLSDEDGAPSFAGAVEKYIGGDAVTELKNAVKSDKAPRIPSEGSTDGFVPKYRFEEIDGEMQRVIDVPGIIKKVGDIASNLQGANTAAAQNDYPPTSDIARATTASATAKNVDELARRLLLETKLVPISAKMVPTIPSWQWEAREMTNVVGVSKRLEGWYDIEEVELGYDKDNGLTTVLKGVKRASGKRARKPILPACNDVEQPQATQEAATTDARPAKAVDRQGSSKSWYFTDGETGARHLIDAANDYGPKKGWLEGLGP